MEPLNEFEEKKLDLVGRTAQHILEKLSEYSEEREEVQHGDAVIALVHAAALSAVYWGVRRESFLGLSGSIYDMFTEGKEREENVKH